MWKMLIDTAAEWSTAGIWIRLLYALFVGCIIGIDRGLKRRGAGIKTHVLVCLGSAIVMLTSEYIYLRFPDAKADMARMGAQVISGVGFLGVGTIMVTGKNQVRGLTTAAGLWTCACVGLAAGIGFIEGATYMLLLIVFTMKILTKLDDFIREQGRIFDLYLEFEPNGDVSELVKMLHEKDVKISMFNIMKNKIVGTGITATLTLDVKDRQLRKTILRDIQNNSAVSFVEEL